MPLLQITNNLKVEGFWTPSRTAVYPSIPYLPLETGIMPLGRSLFQRVFGRLFGRVN